jgi:UDP-N-acetylmuramoylalanine--D-glutamate ligase
MTSPKDIPHWKEFKGKKVVVMGLGIHGGGLGVAQFFAKQGAQVLVTDLQTKADLAASLSKLSRFKNISYVLGEHREEDFRTADLVVKNPAVRKTSSFLLAAKKAGVPVHTEISLFFLWAQNQIVGVTGTKGKTTTTQFIADVLAVKYTVFMGGNMRIPVLPFLLKAKPGDIVVLELSSWQVESLKVVEKSPHIAVITNIQDDHLNTYDSFEEYARAKKLIYAYQSPRDHLVVSRQLSDLKEESVGKTWVYNYSKKSEEELREKGFKLLGKHLVEDAICALGIGELMGVPHEKALRVLAKEKSLFGRLELVKKSGGISWINDTCSTAPYSTIQAMSSFPREHIILIAGGTDKALPYEELARVMKRNVRELILLSGSATEKMKDHLRKDFFETKSLKEAVMYAGDIAKRGDVILFSPAASSFELFKNEFDRGQKFAALVKKYV